MRDGHHDKLATEVALIRRIARRAIDTIPALRQARLLSVDVQAFIGACHFKACPLRLEALLAADGLSFAGDVIGIRRHLDSVTGKLAVGYQPRYRQTRPLPSLKFYPLAEDHTFAARKRRQRERSREAGIQHAAGAALGLGG